MDLWGGDGEDDCEAKRWIEQRRWGREQRIMSIFIVPSDLVVWGD